MNARERFIAIMHFTEADRVPYHELGAWGQTIARWYKEGLPRVDNRGPGGYWEFLYGHEYFGLDRRDYVDLNMRIVPPFQPVVIEENERYVVAVNEQGIKTKALKEGTVLGSRPSMDQYLEFPVKNRADFRKLKRRYDPHSPFRYPKWWKDKVKCWQIRDYPLCLVPNGCLGFYGTLREWMGTENLSYAFYDNPVLIHEMTEFLADFIIEATRRALEEVKVDYFNFWEDLAGKGGPLISPRIFREFMFDPYKRVIDFLHRHGVDIITLDSDGEFEVLIPLLLEVGVTGIWPLEVAAGMDPVCLRKKYGKNLALSGGIDKRVLTKDKKAIEQELMSKVPYLIEQGGYIPTIDHAVPPDISLKNFMYYLNLKKKIAEGKLGI